MSEEKHEPWCNSRWLGTACDCKTRHEAHRIPQEPSAVDLLLEMYPRGVQRPPAVVKFLRQHGGG